jgi:hypothetical protein
LYVKIGWVKEQQWRFGTAFCQSDARSRRPTANCGLALVPVEAEPFDVLLRLDEILYQPMRVWSPTAFSPSESHRDSLILIEQPVRCLP